jgi:hypothetical protein
MRRVSITSREKAKADPSTSRAARLHHDDRAEEADDHGPPAARIHRLAQKRARQRGDEERCGEGHSNGFGQRQMLQGLKEQQQRHEQQGRAQNVQRQPASPQIGDAAAAPNEDGHRQQAEEIAEEQDLHRGIVLAEPFGEDVHHGKADDRRQIEADARADPVAGVLAGFPAGPRGRIGRAVPHIAHEDLRFPIATSANPFRRPCQCHSAAPANELRRTGDLAECADRCDQIACVRCEGGAVIDTKRARTEGSVQQPGSGIVDAPAKRARGAP